MSQREKAVKVEPATSGLARSRARIAGVVQGVGFRPYIYRLAKEHGLTGNVLNMGQGVLLEVEGPPRAMEAFFRDIIPRKPPLAHILRVEREEIPPTGDEAFVIVPSKAGGPARTLAPPDTALCADCQAELFDPANRRFHYPFINCTNCGPRYTIIQGLPYDRPQTTMAPFKMCPDCAAEYHDPENRRFHAQPNACPVCGPRVWLADAQGVELPGDALPRAAQLLGQGRILAIKGLGGFHLAVDAADEQAVVRLRTRKQREEKPLAVMVADMATARRLIQMDLAEEELLTSPVRPILLAKSRPNHDLAPSVAPGLDILGVMIAYTPLHQVLLSLGPPVLVMTSGNLSDEPICMDNDEALERLSGVADHFLLHDRDIHTRADDSVAMSVLGQPRVVRRARGYVPRPVFLEAPGPDVLALGPELKNTLCLTRGEEAFISSHVGDLKDAETLDYYQETLGRLKDLVQAEPQALAVDLHPDYLSTRQAEAMPGLPVIRVQHHVAHTLSVMAELGLKPPLLGLSLDGTGLGADRTVWGCELLVVEADGFTRLGHLAPMPLPGGDKAAKEPWRSACGLLFAAFDSDWADHLPAPLRDWLAARPGSAALVENLGRMMAQGLNSPQCSSAGRLFDAIAALCGLRQTIAYEGQAAVLLEGALDPHETGAYPLPVGQTGQRLILDTAPLAQAVLHDAAAGTAPGAISARFHQGLINALAQAAAQTAQTSGIKDIALSGGCFMNRRLLTGLTEKLKDKGLAPHSHRDVPTNDGGISLGQALGARMALAAGKLKMWEEEKE